jgi:hypothetical protein
MPARRRDADITRIPAQRHLLQHMIASSANRFHLFAFYRQAQRARGHVAAGDLGANACFAGSYAFYFVDCCSLGEGVCWWRTQRAETVRPQRRQTDNVRYTNERA